MKKRTICLALSLGCTMASGVPSFADDALYQKYWAAAEQSFQAQQYKKAELSLVKAVKRIEMQEDATLARTLTKLAAAQRLQDKAQDASANLVRAMKIYEKLGHVEQPFADEWQELAKVVRIADLARLGAPSERALKENSAVVTMQKTPVNSVNVALEMPLKMEKPLNSGKIDGIQLAKSVSFEMTKQPDGQLHLADIKGFQIHSVEKGMWVNLLDLVVKQPDAEGKYDITLTAGKAGITKVVEAKLPARAFEPIGGIAAQFDDFNAPVTIALPVVAAPTTATEPAPSSVPAATPTTTTVVQEATATPAPDMKPVAVPVATPAAVPAEVPVEAPAAAPVEVPSAAPAEVAPSARPQPKASQHQASDETPKAKSKSSKKEDDDDDDDDDNDKNEKEDDHLVLHLLGKGLKALIGSGKKN
jgi:hypothetical protein